MVIKKTGSIESTDPLAILNKQSYRIAERWIFKPTDQSIQFGEQTITLRKKNAAVLNTLIQHQNETVANEDLYAQVWGDSCVNEGVIKRSICDLRSVFGDEGKNIITTVPRNGYRLSTQVELWPLAEQYAEAPSGIDPSNDIQLTPHPSKVSTKSLSAVFSHALAVALTLLLCLVGYLALSNEPGKVLQSVSTDSILLRESLNQIQDQVVREKILGTAEQKINALAVNHPDRDHMLAELVQAYRQFGFFDHAIRVNKKLAFDVEKRYGRYHRKTQMVQQTMVDTLIAAGRSQTAFDLARTNLENSLRFNGDNAALVAGNYLRLAEVNLLCVFPNCSRNEALANGLLNADKAIEVLKQASHPVPVMLADAYMAKNWYVKDFAPKQQLMEQALALYLEHLGEFDGKTAELYLQLGRTRILWQQDSTEGIELIERSLRIYSFIGSEDDDEVLRARFYLGQALMFAGQFERTIETLKSTVAINKPNAGCETVVCIKSLYVLAKTYLYKNDLPQAELMAAKLKQVLELKPVHLAFSLIHEIKAVLLRLDSMQPKIKKTPTDLREEIAKNRALFLASRNGLAVHVIAHELHNQLLVYYPQLFDSNDTKHYIHSMDNLAKYPNHPYLAQSDRQFIIDRANKNCQNVGSEFCAQLQKLAFFKE